ncbi:hypothetical protein M404DRAFT_29798 [Pisolithus tinctorius Marx 270]|uniref:Uncharacterized protein n=1 Tax=Pisolithus tinctorius Marx 270 TaxID=870435 RepID=A0A0C3NXX8_PISTI|nr:hypothetical protein M404DRAFT_29798 [Pisolithus tinctorius Marx 270]
MNWPADVIFPAEEHHRKANGKGISDLTLTDCSKFIAALKDQNTNQLHFQHLPKLKGTFLIFLVPVDANAVTDALLSSKKLVITSAPPCHDSNLTRGKHMFMNSTRNKTKKRAQFEVDKTEGLGNSDSVEEVSMDKKPSSSTAPWPKALSAPQQSLKLKAAGASEVISLSSSSQSQSKSSGDDFHPTDAQDDDNVASDVEMRDESCKGTTDVVKAHVPAIASDTTHHIVATGSAQKTLQSTTSDPHKVSADTANLTLVIAVGSNAPGVTCSISNITDSCEIPSILHNTSVPVSAIPSPNEASDTSTISNGTSTSLPEGTQVLNESDMKLNAGKLHHFQHYMHAANDHLLPWLTPSTPVNCSTADLFVSEDDGPDGGFFSGYASGPATRQGSPTTHAKCPALWLVQGKAHLGSDQEPFNLQLCVFQDKPEIPSTSSEVLHTASARLCAAKEGHLLMMESEADNTQQTSPHSLHGTHLSLTLGPGGPHIAYNVPHSLHATQFNHPSQ